MHKKKWMLEKSRYIKNYLYVLLFVCLIVYFSSETICLALPPPVHTARIGGFRAGAVLVKLKVGRTYEDLIRSFPAAGIHISKRFRQVSQRLRTGYALITAGHLRADELLRLLRSSPMVKKAELDHKKWLLDCGGILPNDPRFGEQWALCNAQETSMGIPADISATEAWGLETGSSKEVIAVIDTGIDYLHPDLKANTWINKAEANGITEVDDDGNGYIDDIYGIDTGEDDSDPMDIDGHGTHVAGIIAAAGNNGVGITGINWHARIMALKGFRPSGYMYESDEIELIDYCLDMKERGVDIVAINASYGCTNCYSDIERDAIDAAGQAGILFVAAAGNDRGDDDATPYYPASFTLPNIISVAATNEEDRLATFSNYGVSSVDLGAPGYSILSTYYDRDSGHGYAYMSGTSMAAPQVSGATALLAASYPWEDVFCRKMRVFAGVDRIGDLEGKTLTGGRLNLYNSLTLSGGCCPGDIDQNGTVDLGDLGVFAQGFSLLRDQQGYLKGMDFDGDGDLDGYDLAILSGNFGRVDCLSR